MTWYQERWWHRLLKVVLFVLVLIIALFCLLLANDERSQYRTYHSWQDGGIPPKLQAGKERCVVRAGSYGSLENCGSFYSADGLLRDLQTNSAVRIEKLPSRYRLEDAANIADQVTRFNYLATWQGREETPDQFWKALWWAFVATSIAALLAMGVFRLAIYVAHGRKPAALG